MDPRNLTDLVENVRIRYKDGESTEKCWICSEEAGRSIQKLCLLPLFPDDVDSANIEKKQFDRKYRKETI